MIAIPSFNPIRTKDIYHVDENEENSIGKASSEQDKNTATNVPILIWPCPNKEEATIEVPHSGISPNTLPTTGPNLFFPSYILTTLSSTKEKRIWKTNTKANILAESINASKNTSNIQK